MADSDTAWVIDGFVSFGDIVPLQLLVGSCQLLPDLEVINVHVGEIGEILLFN